MKGRGGIARRGGGHRAARGVASARGGRGGRGRGSSRPARGGRRPVARRPRRPTASTTTPKEPREQKPLNLDIMKNPSEYFTQNATFEQHMEVQNSHRDRYLATLVACQDYGIEIIPNARARSLASAMARKDKELVDFFLNGGQYGFVDVLKAVTILDSAREIRAIEKKIARVAKTGSVMKTAKLGKLKNNLNNLAKIKPASGSCSGALAKSIRRWVRHFTQKELEFFALHMPKEQWKRLADVVHLNPTKDFPAAPWFLPYVFGQDAPAGSMVAECSKMTHENVNELVAAFGDLPYSFLKKYKDALTDKSKETIAARQEKLDTIVWYYEDLACDGVDNMIRARLERGEKLSLGYGKLMERLLMFKSLREHKKAAATFGDNSLFALMIPLAERDLLNFKSTVESPVAVLGDASSSMEVAIKTSTIISSLLATICAAKISFFNSVNFYSSIQPKNIMDVLTVANDTHASGSTSPAASLVPYYDKKEVVKTFILVTDEEENTNASTADQKSWRFFELFQQYRKDVYPASLIFVSFLSSQHSQGQMYSRFVRENAADNVLQFKFDRSRPDLTKLDSILGKLCSQSSRDFSGHVEHVEGELKTRGLVEGVKHLRVVNEMMEQANASISYS